MTDAVTQMHWLLATINAALSIGVTALAVHRLNITTGLTKAGIRAQFLLLAAAGGVSAVRMWLPTPVPEWPGVTDCLIAAALLAYMLLGYRRWRAGAPADTCTCRPAEQPSDLMGLDAGRP